MWRMIEKPKVLTATPALARRWVEMERAPNDRELNAKRLEHVKACIEGGEFRVCEWASVYCKETDKEYRVNGKHTSKALSEMNGGTSFPVLVGRYEAETLQDVAHLYATFDTRESVRNAGDINQAVAASNPELAGLNRRLVSLAVAGLAYQLWESDAHRRPAIERAELMLAHPDFVLFTSRVVTESKEHDHVRRRPVVAAMAKTYFKAKAAAGEFWTLVRDQSGPRPDTPDRKLATYLLRSAINAGRGAAREGRNRVTTHEVYAKCIHAWNAWRNNESTDLRYYPQAKTPSAH